MTNETKPETPKILQDQNTLDVAKPESVEFRKPVILPPPIPGQTAWSIVPW